MNTISKIILIISIIIIGIILVLVGFKRENKIKEVMTYDIIRVADEEFLVDNIKNIYRTNAYSGEIKIEFKDGTVLYTTTYILKNK